MSKLGKRQLHELYYYMKLTRRLEEGIARLHLEGKVPGPVYMGVGREAVGIGVAYPLRTGDFLASSISTVGSLAVRLFCLALISWRIDFMFLFNQFVLLCYYNLLNCCLHSKNMPLMQYRLIGKSSLGNKT